MEESIVFSGKIGEVAHIKQPDGRVFEQYRRPPGTRLVIISPENKILITREHRHETGNIDLRLPGGKVCDTLEEYHALRASGRNIPDAAAEAATKEALQETGLFIHDPRLITVANAGATVSWDLYFYEVRDYINNADGQQLEQGENIEVTWMKPAAIRQAIAAGQMQEWRSAGVLLGKVLPGLD